MNILRSLIFLCLISNLHALKYKPSEPVNPKITSQLYLMMQDFHDIMSENNVPYFITCGTLLGAVRNQEIINWDDDIDVGIFDVHADQFCQLEAKFNARGYQLSRYPKGFFFKISSKNGEHLPTSGAWVGNYPWIDIMVFTKQNNKFVYHPDGPLADLVQSNFTDTDLLPLTKLKLGNLEVWGPKDPKPFLNQVYPDWESKYIILPNHSNDLLQKVILRPTTLEDLDTIVELLDQLGYPQKSIDMCKQKIELFSNNQLNVNWVACIDNHIIGFLALNIITPFYKEGLFARVDTIVVDMSYRKLGIGKMLMHKAEEYAAERGCSRIFLTSGNHRTWAHDFYNRLGYISNANYYVKNLEK